MTGEAGTGGARRPAASGPPPVRRDGARPRFAVRLFGTLELWREGERLGSFPTTNSKHLFGYLSLHAGRRFPRDVLMGVFFGEMPGSTARKRLRLALWRARRTVNHGDREDGPIAAEGDTLGFLPADDCWLDVRAFERRLARAGAEGPGPSRLRPAQVSELVAALELYRDHLMVGVYADWCSPERERLRSLCLGALRRLREHHAVASEWEGALRSGRRILAVDPLSEPDHRRVMQILYAAGNRPAAIRHFQRLAALLERELRVAPMADTRTLFRAILEERDEAVFASGSAPSAVPGIAPAGGAARHARRPRNAAETPADREDALSSLREAASALDRARERLLALHSSLDLPGPPTSRPGSSERAPG